MPGLVGDVDPAHLADKRVDPLVAGCLALEAVEDFFEDQRRGEPEVVPGGEETYGCTVKGC
nr:hypothetical protein [Streptomyces erythrochromogenes]